MNIKARLNATSTGATWLDASRNIIDVAAVMGINESKRVSQWSALERNSGMA